MYELFGIQLLSFAGILLIGGILFLLAYFWPAANRLPIINTVNKSQKPIAGIVLIVAAMLLAGTFSMPFGAEDTTTEAVDYYGTSDITFYTYDAHDGSEITGDDLHLYQTGAPTADYYNQEGDADTIRTVTPAAGGVEVAGWDAEKFAYTQALLDSSNYYNELEKVDMRVEKDEDDNAKSVTMRATAYGTISSSKSDDSTSLSSDGDTDTITLVFENTADDTEIWAPAVELDLFNTTLNDVGTGAHEEEVDGTTYIVFDETEVGPQELLSVTLTIEADSGDGTIDATFNDLFGMYGDDAFNTDSDVRSASSDDMTQISWS